MKIAPKLLLTFICVLLSAMEVYGESNAKLKERALPPAGYTLFCIEQPLECVHKNDGVSKIVLNKSNRAELEYVNTWVNSLVTYQLDRVVWRKKEKWNYPTQIGHKVFGDCEDYMLLKRKMLIDRGFPQSALLITLVRTKDNSSHAVLTVVTTTGEYVLDSLNNKIVRWEKTGYRLIKRQSAEHPNRWVKHD